MLGLACGMRVLHASAKVWHRGGPAKFGKVWQSLASKGPACRSSAWAAHAPEPRKPCLKLGEVLDRLGPHELLCRPHTLYLGCSILSHSRIGGYGCTRVAGGIKPRSRESRWFPTFRMVPHGPPWSPMVPCGPPWSPVVPLVCGCKQRTITATRQPSGRSGGACTRAMCVMTKPLGPH